MPRSFNRAIQAVVRFSLLAVTVACSMSWGWSGWAQEDKQADYLRQMQFEAVDTDRCDWAHWGTSEDRFSSWTNHSNRLIPVYTFGMGLDSVKGPNSVYRSADALKVLYGSIPEDTVNEDADYFDQTDIYRLQKAAIAAGKKHVVLFVFDGMDWDTTRAATIYRTREIGYESGRGSGLAFQDYSATETDFGSMVTSPWVNSASYDVDAQVITKVDGMPGGYNPLLGGLYPWSTPSSYAYLISQDRGVSHAFTDSASSATSMTAGIKTYNAAVNVTVDGEKVVPIARDLQERGFAIGVVTSVPISHATPAAAYANNVTRNDYQDLSRDLLGLASVANRTPLSGVDVLIGGGWGELRTSEGQVESERKKQGINFSPGNRYLADEDLRAIDIENGGPYRVAQRTAGKLGSETLFEAAAHAAEHGERLFGFFGVIDGHLPYATADGGFDPTRGVSSAEKYSEADLSENPTLADMTRAALQVLEKDDDGFWLMIEAGDVDWANHNNNIDDAIGATYSGEAAFLELCQWCEEGDRWDDTVVILTADHGHLLILDQPEALLGPSVKKANVSEQGDK